jgi:hypothetical protein
MSGPTKLSKQDIKNPGSSLSIAPFNPGRRVAGLDSQAVPDMARTDVTGFQSADQEAPRFDVSFLYRFW